jgi:hypothetical protein
MLLWSPHMILSGVMRANEPEMQKSSRRHFKSARGNAFLGGRWSRPHYKSSVACSAMGTGATDQLRRLV